MMKNSEDFPYKKAIVTGGAGFIGSHIAEALVNLGVETISIDNYSVGKLENISHLLDKPNFKEVVCDIMNYGFLREQFEGVDIVFHNAVSKKNVCMMKPWTDLRTNALGTLNLLHLSREYGVRRFIHASTGSVCGNPKVFPQDETHPTSPVSFYGISKLAAEKYVKVFHQLYGLDATILRYFHVYGPRQDSSDNGGVVAIFIRNLLNNEPITIYGDGTQVRHFTYVKDIVKANLHMAVKVSKASSSGQIYNCATFKKTTIYELADKLSLIMQKNDVEIIYRDRKPDDIHIFDIDSSKLRNTNFVFQTPFVKGIRETINYYEEK